jgi:hypothetical protein
MVTSAWEGLRALRAKVRSAHLLYAAPKAARALLTGKQMGLDR